MEGKKGTSVGAMRVVWRGKRGNRGKEIKQRVSKPQDEDCSSKGKCAEWRSVRL